MRADGSRDFIFRRDESNRLHFVGDFDGLYSSHDDPWNQSLRDEHMQRYYSLSRTKIATLLGDFGIRHVLEVGCGLGSSTHDIAKLSGAEFVGMDISETAIQKATARHPHLKFFHGDIMALDKEPVSTDAKFDGILLNQILWYVMHDLPSIFRNCKRMLKARGYILFSTAFLPKQDYGADIFLGYSGFIEYLQSSINDFLIVHSHCSEAAIDGYFDGHVVLRSSH